MKLHLPLSLRSSLLALIAVSAIGQTVSAGIMNSDVSMVTYTDFGQNKGRYVTDADANALLKHLRQQSGGVVISYDGGQILLPHEMPEFTSSSNNGSYTFTGYNALLSVQHMPVYNGGLTGNDIGNSNQIVYQAIEYGTNPDTTFLHSPDGGRSEGNVKKDHKISRLSKIVTDVSSVALYSGTSQEMANTLSGELIYRAGAGEMYVRSSEDGTISPLTGSHSYIIGGVDTLDDTGSTDKTVEFNIWMNNPASANAINSASPLPYASHRGDSGSPLYVYHNGRYEYIGSATEANGSDQSRFVGAIEYDKAILNQYNKVVESGATVKELHIGAVNGAGTTVSGNVHEYCHEPGYDTSVLTNVTATPYYGKVTTGANGTGQVLQSFVGVQSGINTWNSLAGVINNDNWYNYGTGFLNADDFDYGNGKLSFADLFLTENLVFKSDAESTSIVLDATVDLGIGYAHFSGEGDCKEYTIKSGGSGNYQFNHAGYVVDKGVSVHLQLTGDANHVYEWRKVGEGNLHIEGSGDNKVLLNVGGTGTTYLNRAGGGYAAYNVLANTGATVVINDINQIKRDFTFGNDGGVLDMNGNSMEWNNSHGADAAGFTIHALDEQAIISNSNTNSATVLTWTQEGAQTFLGSFVDDGTNSVLQFVYDGKAGSQLTLHSIKTSLTAPGSGMIVNSGTLMLSGTNTIHGKGSATGANADRYFNSQDWHYADVTSDVTVKSGGTFALGSHARLTGDVTVQSGGTFVMHEGVNHAEEFIEGGQRAESTAVISDYYGLKGNVALESGSVMKVEFSDDTTVKNSYNKNISGAGDVQIDAASAILQLGGDNSFSGKKTLIRGGLVGDSATALGNTTNNKWVVQKDGWIASHKESAADLLARIDTGSTGTIALSADTTTQLNLSQYTGLYLGAEEGTTVNYGATGTSEALQAVNGAWRLGGGGGTLVVNYLLAGNNNLMLGASESSTGTVHLANTNNSFSGSISFAGEKVILTYEDGALGNAMVDLAYGNSMVLKWSREIDLISKSAEGVALVDKVPSADLDMSQYGSLALGSSTSLTYTGDITLAENQAYRFSSVNGATFTVGTELQAGHDVIVDAQGSTGGRVVLLNPDAMDGNLSVHGYRDSSATGNITLELAQDISLSNTLTVGDDATVQGKNIEVSSSSGSIELYGKLEYDSLTVSNGATLNMRAGGSLDTNTAATIADGGIMRLNSQTLQNKVDLKNGGKLYGNGGTIGANATVQVTEGTGTLSADTGTLEVSGFIGAKSGSTMVLEGSKVNLRASEINTDGGTLDVKATTVSLVNLNRIGGTLSIGANVELNTSLYSAAQSREHFYHTIDALDIRDGYQLKINQTSTSNVHVWNIASLTGTGELYWIAAPYTYEPGASRMILSGANSFEGKIRLMQRCPNASWGWAQGASFLQHLELAHDEAAKGAVISLEAAPEGGDLAAYNRPAIAINTQNAHIRGIEGWENSKIYAGPAPTNRTVNTDNLSKALNTLTITGSGEYRYAGQIQGTEQYGLNIVMDGEGKQVFSNQWSTVHDITALKGSLVFEAAPVNLYGDIGIAQGAQMTIGSGSYSLNSGHQLIVLSGAEGQSAVLNNSLVLNGGSLLFDAYGTTAASLATSGVSLGSGISSVRVEFGNTEGIQLGTNHWLASGNWSALSGKLTVTSADYLNTTISAGTNGLYATFSMKDGWSVWDGDESVLKNNANVVFGRFSDSDTVTLTSDAGIAKGVFDNAEAITITSDNNSSLTAGTLTKENTGDLHINAMVNATSMSVQDSFELFGTGKLSVGTLNLAAGTVVTVRNGHLAATNAIGGNGTLHLGTGSSFTTGQNTLATSLKLGEVDSESRVELGFTGNGLSVTGNVTIEDNTTLSVKGNGSLSFNSAFNSLKALELQSGVSMTTNSSISTHLVLDGGSASLSGDNNTILDGDVTVKNGGTLTFKGTGADIIDYNITGKKLTVAGGTIDFGTTRQTMGSWSLNLSDGAMITGTGNATYGAMDFNNNNSTITATSGENTISAVTRLRNGNNLNYDVSEGATLTVSGRIHADGATGKGSITKNGAGILVLTSANTYANTTTINGGTLKTSVVGALGSSSIVINKGATLELMPAIAGITYENGKLSGSGCLSVALTTADNTVNLGISFTGETYVRSGRLQTSGATVGSVLRLADGAELKANGDLAADIILEGRTLVWPGSVETNFNGTVTGKGTFVHTINQYYRFNKDVKLAGFVQEDRNMWARNWFNANAEIETVSLDGGHLYFNKDSSLGSMVVKQSEAESYVEFSADGSHTIGSLTHTGGNIKFNGSADIGSLTQTAGKINFNGSAEVTGRLNGTGGNLELQSGELRLTYTGDDGNRINNLDASIGNSAAGTLSLAKDVELTVTGNIWARSNTGIHLDSGALLDISGKKITIANRAEEGTATLAATTPTDPGEYTINRTGYQISNAHVTYTGGDATIENKLTNSSIENAGNGTLKVNNAENSLTAVHATGGSIKLFSDAVLDLKELEIATSLSVSAYSQLNEQATQEARINVSGTADFGAGATLNADLVMKSGATLKVADTVQMGSDVYLESGLKLDGAQYDSLSSLRVGEKVTLFSGVDTLFLGNTPIASDAITLDDRVLANEYFSNLTDDYLLIFDTTIGEGLGELSIAMVPEPTTATLSILALAGLAMRRRRK